MSEQTKEGERMTCILNGCMSEQAEEGERPNLHLEYLDFRTDGRG